MVISVVLIWQVRLNAMSLVGGDVDKLTRATSMRTEVLKLAEEVTANLTRSRQQHDMNYGMTEGG